MSIQVQGLNKHFNQYAALADINLDFHDGELVALLGPSGCGKTTTLRMIAGFTEPTAGQILVDGKNVSTIPPYRRNIGIFFQNYALFPHMTVLKNLTLAPMLLKKESQQTAEAADALARLAEGARRIAPADGAPLFGQGDPPDAVYAVLF